jgi:hypothetical protein
LPNIIEDGVGLTWEILEIYRQIMLVRKHPGMRQLGRPLRRWKDNINMVLREVGYEDVEWIELAEDM